MERVKDRQLAMMPIEFKLNGKTVVGRPDEPIITTAQKHGVEIPHLCHGGNQRSDGNCRSCVVEIKGERTLAPSCCRYPTQGMEVTTDSPRALTSQKMVIELLLSDMTEKSYTRDNKVVEWARMLDVGQPRFKAREQPKSDLSHPAIAVNLDPFVVGGVLDGHFFSFQGPLAAVVTIRDERHGADFHRHRLAAHDRMQARARGGQRRRARVRRADPGDPHGQHLFGLSAQRGVIGATVAARGSVEDRDQPDEEGGPSGHRTDQPRPCHGQREDVGEAEAHRVMQVELLELLADGGACDNGWVSLTDPKNARGEDPDLRPKGGFSMRGHSVGGFGSVTTKEIALRADMGEATLFRYVSSKLELFLLIYGDEFEQVVNRCEASSAKLLQKGRADASLYLEGILASYDSLAALYTRYPDLAW